MTDTLSFAFINLKPGVGKTTSSVYAAAALQEKGYGPVLVDADKGQSAQRWDELAGGLGFPVIAMAVTDLHAKLPAVVGHRQSAVLDVPQIEDHTRIARGALRWADTWVIPVAPSGIEVDRMMADLVPWLDDTISLRTTLADVVVLLNRTNRAEATRTGPDAEVRRVLTDHGFTVLATQIPHNDGLYRQTYGTQIVAKGTAYDAVVDELLERRAAEGRVDV